jgi:hypothetical protein
MTPIARGFLVSALVIVAILASPVFAADDKDEKGRPLDKERRLVVEYIKETAGSNPYKIHEWKDRARRDDGEYILVRWEIKSLLGWVQLKEWLHVQKKYRSEELIVKPLTRVESPFMLKNTYRVPIDGKGRGVLVHEGDELTDEFSEIK